MCDVLIIGTEPPRPRCDLVLALVGQAAQAFGAVAVRHCAFDSPEAIELGRRLGCRVCTAKQVAEEAGLAVDWVSVHDLIDPKMSSLPPHGRPAHAWSAELDRILEPCQRAAQSVGYLMTPEGEVVHQGSVPSQKRIEAWLSGSAGR